MNWEDKSKEELLQELYRLQNKFEEYNVLKEFSDEEKTDLEKSNRALRTLSQCNHALIRATDETKFEKEFCEILTSTGEYKYAWIAFKEDDENKSVLPLAQSGFEEGYLEYANVTWDNVTLGRGPIGTSIRSCETQVVADALTDFNFTPWREDALNRGYLSLISLPLNYNDCCYGALAIYSDKKNYFVPNEIKLLEELAQDLAYGISTLRDRIARKKFEQELKESEENYRKLVEISPHAIAVHKEGKFVFINDAGLKMIGAEKPEDIIGTSALNVVHPDYKQAVIDRIAKMKNGEPVNEMEEKFVRLDGGIIDVMVSASRINYKGSDAVQIVINDITRLKQIEIELRESEERFRTIFENASIGIYRTAISGEILMANPAFYKMLGYEPNELVGKNIQDIYVHPGQRQAFLDEVISKKKVIGYETVLEKKDGSFITIRNNAKYFKKPDGNGYCIEGTLEDITALKITQSELISAKEKAEEMNRLKGNFLANMSHELRTPLVAILGFAEIFQSEFENSDYLEMANSIHASGNRLLETLNSILDLSRIEAQRIETNPEKVNVVELVEKSINKFRSFADKKNLFIKLNAKNNSVYSMLDVQMASKILNNLINNAVKYTLAGGVNIEVDTIEQDGNNWVKISIKDSGIGIPERSLKLIFDEFRQVSEGLNRNFEGTGIGLTITKKFVEMLGGHITVVSREGVGTEFTVFLPPLNMDDTRNNSIVHDGKLPEQKITKPLPKVLLVENDLPTIDVTKIILRKSYSVEIEMCAKDAIELVKNKKYDAILMDINLGAGFDGTEAMKNIRKIPGYETTPIIAFTAYAMAGDREKFLREGFSDYISKPFDKKTLLDFMENVFKNDHK